MNWTDWLLIVSTIALWALVAYGQWCLRCMERELKGKADKPKPRLRARHAPYSTICEEYIEASKRKERVIGYKCERCDQEVPKGGHTMKRCEEAQKAKEQPMFAPPEEAHDPPMDMAPGAREPENDA